MSSSIGMMTFPIYGKIKNGNQTTNQIFYKCTCSLMFWCGWSSSYNVVPFWLKLASMLLCFGCAGCDSRMCKNCPHDSSNWEPLQEKNIANIKDFMFGFCLELHLMPVRLFAFFLSCGCTLWAPPQQWPSVRSSR